MAEPRQRAEPAPPRGVDARGRGRGGRGGVEVAGEGHGRRKEKGAERELIWPFLRWRSGSNYRESYYDWPNGCTSDCCGERPIVRILLYFMRIHKEVVNINATSRILV